MRGLNEPNQAPRTRLVQCSVDSYDLPFDPSIYPDVPLYNIQAVSAATNVPTITLRSWERRYGVPKPKRDAKGYRLYSRRDIAVTQWLREQVERGVGISRAVNMLQSAPASPAADRERSVLDVPSLRARLLQGVVNLDEAGIWRVMAEGLMVAPVEEVAIEVMQPVLYEIGDLWARGEITVTTEHVGSNVLRSQIAQLVRLSPAPIRPVTAMVACAPGELHDIGPLMLTLFLRRRGISVIYGGASVEPDDFIADVRRVQPQVVCLSASTVESARSLSAVYARLGREFRGIMAFGGRIFNEDQDLRGEIPGDFLGENAATATLRIEESLGLTAKVS